MRKNTNPQSAFFNPRIFAVFILSSAFVWLGMFSFVNAANRSGKLGVIAPKAAPDAPTPGSDTLSAAHRSITYTDSTGAPLNPTPIATGVPNCGPTGALCSTFNLTIDSSVASLTGNQIVIQWQWAVSTVDYDWFIEDSTSTVIAKNQSTADPSTIILPINTPAGTYKLIGTLSTGAPIAYTGAISIQPASNGGSGICNTGNCTPPRYQNYSAGPGQADDAGEPSLGVDWNPNVASLQHDKVNTGGVAFFTSGPHEWRVNFDDCSSPAVNLWEDVSAVTTQQFVLSDPIGFVDHYTSQELGLVYPPPHTPGRVFTLDLVGGQGDSLGSFSDNDGNSYLPGGNGGAGAGPDHETLGGGPYSGTPPATASYPATGTKNGIYYCSQNIAAEAQCSRSDNGGQAFGPSVPIFNPTQCTGGIHGHVKVAPDGTVYVPNSSCGTVGNSGVAVSTDNGVTWTENNVPNSTSTQDPSLGIGQNHIGKPAGNLSGTNTVYLGYADGDGHAKVSSSGNRGATWSTPVDVGAPFGVTHAVFPVVVAGDDNRAAFAFLGTGDGIATTGTCDPYGATLNCKNIWHLYISTTYDGGSNWITVDATPNDPVQQGTVCLQGTTCSGGRNLLDFNDFAIDSQGRGLVGYADGCVNCDNAFTGQSAASHGTVTRQSGGRRLFSNFDPIEPAVPAIPQLVSANRQGTAALITWLEPDNGGSPITGYKVYRGITSGGETFLASVSGNTTTKYLDPNPPAADPVYYYVTAVNAQGESLHCPEISLGGAVVSGNACTFPYLQVDPAGGAGTAPDPTTNGEFTIEHVNIGEPFLNCSDNSLTYLMKVKSLDLTGTGMAVLPQNAEYQILFTITGTDNLPHVIYVELDTFTPNSQALPGISLGRRDPCTAGCGTLDTGITFAGITATFTADGTIQFKVDASAPIVFPAPGAPGNGPAFTWDPHSIGSQMTNITGNTLLFAGAGAGFLETVSIAGPDGTSHYMRVGNQSCSTFIPIAALTASPQSTGVNQTVNFNGTTSHEPTGACATINSYTIDYGDNTGPTRDTQTNSTGLFTHQFTAPGEYTVRLTVSDTNGKTSTNLAQVVIEVTGGVPPLNGAVSRKTHGGAGNFDILLPITGNHGIECRNGPTAGSYIVVVAFANPLSSVTSVSATATTSGGTSTLPTPSGSIGSGSHNNEYTVGLTSVPNASHVSIVLHSVADMDGNFGNITVPMDVLVGDTTGDGTVNSSDVSQTKARSGQTVGSSNFRSDVTVDGTLNSSDVSSVKAKSGTALP